MPLPGYPIPAHDPLGLSKLNEDLAYLEQKTNAMQAPPFTASSEAEMLALEAVVGNSCIRTDITDQSNQFLLKALPPATLENWMQLPMAVSAVSSVNKQTGNVVLNASDINDTASGRSISALLSEKADKGSPQTYALPFTAGIVARNSRSNRYYKTQDNIVHIEFALQKSNGAALIAYETLITLPAGYRPASVVYFLGLGTPAGGSPSYPLACTVDESGDISVGRCMPTVMNDIYTAHASVAFLGGK